MTDRAWRAAWTGWIVSFGVIEYYAIKSRNPKAPLSYYLRHTLGVPYSPMHQRAGQVAFGAGIVWLIRHLYDKTGGAP